jgi:hypothetical protein
MKKQDKKNRKKNGEELYLMGNFGTRVTRQTFSYSDLFFTYHHICFVVDHVMLIVAADFPTKVLELLWELTVSFC